MRYNDGMTSEYCLVYREMGLGVRYAKNENEKCGLDALGSVAEAAGCIGQDVGSSNCKAHLIYIDHTSQCYVLLFTRSILRYHWLSSHGRPRQTRKTG